MSAPRGSQKFYEMQDAFERWASGGSERGRAFLKSCRVKWSPGDPSSWLFYDGTGDNGKTQHQFEAFMAGYSFRDCLARESEPGRQE